ncbi:non-ribosomal peptide synthetase [Streptosporangium violaceochromogenes]|nr:non-ribosomal peptide synthetase [Streptosporangium violaceochromogenes]
MGGGAVTGKQHGSDDLDRRIAALPAERRAVFEETLRRRAASRGGVRRLDPGERAPLSAGQRRMWVLHGLAPSACNYATAVRLRGPLNVAALRAALRQVVRRHEVLRTGFRWDGDEIETVVRPEAGFPFRLVDLSASARPKETAGPLLREESRGPFDLAVPPLLRVTVFRLAPGDHLVLLVLHHIATDGWSNGVLIEELSALYRALLAGEPAPLPVLPVQYRDYAAWQSRRLRGEERAALTAFWSDQVRDLPRLDLPTDLPRPAEPRGEGASHGLLLPSPLARRLDELRRREGGSLFTLVLAALVAVLRTVTGQRDLVVGTLVAGRSRTELEGLIGYFVNVVLLRFPGEDRSGFRELWRHVRERVLAAQAHQELPYEELLRLARADGRADAEPPVRVVCVAHETPPALDLAGLTAEAGDVDLGGTQFDLTVEVRRRPDGLQIAFQYDVDLFTPATVRLLAGHLRTALERVADAPGLPCDRLLSPEPVPRRRTAAGDDACLHELFEERAARAPDAVAIVTADRQITYRGLNARANRVARRLRAMGVRPEDRVALLLPRSPEAVTAMLGALKAGAAYVPLDPGHPAARLADVLADAAPAALVTTTAARDRCPGYAGPVLCLDGRDAGLRAEAATDLRLPVRADGLAYLIHTSGSTGRPKGVLGPHRGAVNRIRWLARTHPFRPGEVCAARTAVGFVDAVWETFGPLVAGVPLLVLAPDEVADPLRLTGLLARHRVTRLVGVPSLAGMLLDEIPDLGDRLPALRLWVLSGEPLTEGLARRFHDRLPGRTLLNLYGSTEVAADATVAEVPSGPPGSRVPIGRPIGGVTARVRDPGLRASPVLARGELHVGGECLARGYHRRPADTAAVFLPDPDGPPGARAFRTGDAVRRRSDGLLDYLGRLDRQVKVRGHRVEPGEVERALLDHPGVHAAAVTARPDADGSVTLVAHVVVDGSPAPALRDFLRRRLPDPMVPGLFVEVPALPLTPAGKVDRSRLPAPRDPDAEARRADPPRTRTEAAVAEVFAELLPGWPGPGRSGDFFALGGHSVLAARTAARLRERCGVDVGLRDLFAAPTVAGLAARIEGRRSGPAPLARRIVPAPEALTEPFPLTDVQQAYYVGRDGGLDLGEVATHAYLELAATGLDVGRFQAALRGVIARHPMLRAVVRPDGRQQVLADVPLYRVAVRDLRRVSEAAERRHLTAVREEMSHQVLPAGRWPLFEVRVSLLRDGGARVHVSVDALICDAYSFGLVMAELGARYLDPGWEPPPLAVGFRDYVLAEREYRGSAGYAAALDYWRKRVASLPPGPDLPLAKAPETLGRPRFERRSGRIAAPEWATLKARAASAGLTPSGLLLAAFAETLTAWSRRPRYSLMLTVFQREPLHPQVGEIVGDFTSLTLLEVDHTGPGGFADRARSLQRRLWAGLDRSAVSGVTVMREWAARNGGRPRPVTPVVFTSNLPIADGEEPAGAGAWTLGEPVYGITQTPQVHLDHQVGEQRGELLFNWDAVGELFAPGVLDGMFDAYRRLLSRLAEDAGAWRRPARIPLPAVQRDRRAAVNTTAAPPPERSLHDAVFAAADRLPDRVAVVDGDLRLTYRELAAWSHRVARTLLGLGTGPGDLVAVVGRKGAHQVSAVLGALECGAAFVPMEPDLPAARLTHLIRRAGARVVLTHRAVAGDLSLPDGVRSLVVDDENALAADGGPLKPARGPGAPADLTDLAYVVFTSGSTGEPKGVMIDHRGAANTIGCVNRRFGVGPHDRVLAVSSLGFDLAVYDLFGVLTAGGTVVLPDHFRRRDPAHWAELVARERVTVWNSVPALAEVLTGYAEALSPEALGTLRVVLLSGDWIPVTLPDRIRRLAADARVTGLGGATEGSIWSVWYPVGEVDPAWRSIPYGVPMDNQRMHVLDHTLAPRPDWVAGDLYIGGTGVALGYLGDPVRTAWSFPPRPRTGERLYRTGDIARYLPDGTLEFLGREDNQVKISGFRVELGEIEAALERLPAVRSAAVVADGDPRGEKRLVGYVAAEPGERPDTAELRRRLAEVLPGHLVPSTLHLLEELPLTGNGKVDRGELRRHAGRHRTRTKPRGGDGRLRSLVTELAALWREVLEVGEVGPDDGFFALGGTSLQAIRLLTLVQRSKGVRIPLGRLLEAPTVRALAEAVSEAVAEKGTEKGTGAGNTPAAASDGLPVLRPDPERRHEPFPLTDIQQAYWLGRRTVTGLGGVATHSYVELDVDDLDQPRLELAVGRLVDRHEALRTIVRPDGRQRVLPEVPPYRVLHEDLRGMRPDKALERLAAVRDEMSHAVRDAGRWPLFELRTHRVDEARTRLHLSLDLLVADAHSMRVLTGELLTLYHDPAAGLPELTCSFRDYLLAMEEFRDGPAHRRARRYWERRLPELPPAPQLPLIARPEDLLRPRFERLTTGLEPDDWSALRAWAAATGLTPSAVVCAAFAHVLGVWSTTPRFTLNLTTFNRFPIHPQVHALVGDFTATTLLAVDAAAPSVAELARRIQARMWQDLEHRTVSGVEVLRALRRDPARRGDALMPVVFTSVLPDGVPLPAAPASWRARQVFSVSQTPQVLLDHQVGEVDGRLVCTWDHVPAAFPPGLVPAMFGAFGDTLAALVTETGRTAGRTAEQTEGGQP